MRSFLAIILFLVSSNVSAMVIGKKPVVKAVAAPKKAFSFPSFGKAKVAPPAPEPTKTVTMGGVPKWATDFMRQQAGGL
eukprot:CAMPEP_0171951830 /NCGR_PEP_ID=MMETSP0993-20121228/85892_1 /TAXON_ID=483369 /ORGANISM="non described non described, Strain CCMP2098" /LENGTH=78 /DNA_ID=CAMNT_0012597061 /DNA_START=52 /DNA_END=288 /DNA_ORIENTATION=+